LIQKKTGFFCTPLAFCVQWSINQKHTFFPALPAGSKLRENLMIQARADLNLVSVLDLD